MTTETTELRGFTTVCAAERLGISLTTLRRWLKDGTLRYVQRDRKIIIPASEITRFLSNLVEPAGEQK